MIQPNESLDDEILRRAERQRQRDLSGRSLRVVPPSDGSIHISNVTETDTSDTRRFGTGIANIDSRAYDAKAGWMTVLGATTGRGKTVFAEQIARANAMHHKVLFASLEQTGEEIRDSMTARDMGITLQEYEKEMRTGSDEFLAARRRLADLDLHIWRPAYGRPRTPKAILDAAARVKADLLIIDHARRVEGWSAGKAANDMAQWFAEAASEARIHLLLLAQLKVRQGKDYGTRPHEGDFADSTQLPQEAARVILLHRPFAGDKKKDTVTEVLIPKNRFGPVITTHLTWFGPTRSFYSMDEAEEAQCLCCKPKTPKAKKTDPVPTRDPDEMTPAEEDALYSEAQSLF